MTARVRNWLSHATEPQILYPVIAVLALAGIWGTTLNLVATERATAERHAAGLARELTETYEAHVLRAVNEIDKTLKVVKYAHELRGPKVALEELKMRALLPPTLLFTVAIADSKGEIVASNRPMAMTNVADRSYFAGARDSDGLAIGLPQRRPGYRGMDGAVRPQAATPSTARFPGIAMVSVDAAYFVSSYDLSRLGERGFLGVLGVDGVFRAGRSGETVTAGASADYASIVPGTEAEEVEATVSTNAWDGVRRYTSAGQLYDYPLAVIVGLAEDDQLAGAHRQAKVHLWVATGASLLLLAGRRGARPHEPAAQAVPAARREGAHRPCRASGTPRQSRQPHRAPEPQPVQRAPGAEHQPGAVATTGSWRCCSSTSTASRTSTIPSGTRPATSC